ncbi:hypothetical protein ANME2D_02312 [Candidatus Methanoperedens nitroreducens]|uniref:Uncharacterized protein n=2 Tax=Candidatus Methanoperedens nitratireducens TaxID=1392998 RepID=A0A062V2I1_9EURY|nr:hypothetical protein ANME2D_02312 [Candidatus Methanoperedens nitroreducens]
MWLVMLIVSLSLVAALTLTISALTVEQDHEKSYQKEIKIALSNTDISDYIRSVEVLPPEQLQEKCGSLNPSLLGCTVSMFNDTTDEFEYAKIYLSDFANYLGCKTFSRVLYHEIGHMDYSYYYGSGGNESVRERAADDYADRFVVDMC